MLGETECKTIFSAVKLYMYKYIDKIRVIKSNPSVVRDHSVIL